MIVHILFTHLAVDLTGSKYLSSRPHIYEFLEKLKNLVQSQYREKGYYTCKLLSKVQEHYQRT